MRSPWLVIVAVVVSAACSGGADKSPAAPTPVASVAVTPAALTLRINESQQLSATSTSAVGGVLTGRAITWSVTDPSIASVSSAGLVMGLKAGSTSVSATSEGKSGIASVTVLTPPAVKVTLSVAKVFVGDTLTVTWSSSAATSCIASGAWTDAKATQGTLRAIPTAGGVAWYRMSCSGDGGTTSDSAKLVVPMPVYPTSYENNTRIIIDSPTLPSAVAMGIPNPDWLHGGSGAFADFFQEGTYSAVVTKTGPPFGTTAQALTPGTLYFVRRDAVGNWHDDTRTILTDQTSCISPRKALVADFNNDRRPDVLFSCAGPDEDVTLSHRPTGEYSRLLLSQADGNYRNIIIPFWGYAHSGSAGDLNGDGNIDVVLGNNTDTQHALGFHTVTEVEPYVLLGDGKGGFTLDLSRLQRVPPLQNRFITDLELIDLFGTGKLDLFFSGPNGNATGANPYMATCCDVGSGFYRNDGSGHFLGAPSIFPNLKSPAGLYYDAGMDVVVKAGTVFLLQVRVMYDGMLVSRYDLTTQAGQTVYERTTPFIDGWSYLTWLYPRADGMMVARTVDCPTTGFATSRCGVAFPWR